MNKILLTGSTGFIGKEIYKELIKNNYKIDLHNRNQNSAKYSFDILKKVNDDFGKNTDIVIHCAWENVKDVYNESHAAFAKASFNLISTAINNGVKNIIVIGSCFEYGKVYGPISASTKTIPNTPYSIAKDSLRSDLQELKSKIQFNLLWVRPFYVFEKGLRDNTFIGQLNNAIDNEQPDFKMSLGEQLLDFISSQEVAQKLVQAVNKKILNGTYNLGSAKPKSLRRFAEELILERKANINLLLGSYKLRDYESEAFWASNDETNL